MQFELLKPFGGNRPGALFNSFGGLVSGISDNVGNAIKFTDTDYFKPHEKAKVNLIGLAFAIVGPLYQDKVDKGGEPMIMHLIRVMLNPRCNTELRKVLALLHDSAEDGLITLDQLHGNGIPTAIIGKLNILWHKEDQTYEEYIKLVSTDPDCTAVKLADLEDNSQITRLKGLRKKDFERMEKYHYAYTYLKN